MKTAMILAAGRGERLRPLTDTIPKALCPVAQKPIIEYHVSKLAASGFERIVINHAYLGGKIRDYLGNGTKWDIEIRYAPECPGGLETGGGIYNALDLLGTKPFLIVNVDIFTDYDFRMLSLPEGSMIKFVLIANAQTNKIAAPTNKGDFGLNEEGYLTNQGNYIFSGIAYYHPLVFKHCHFGRYSIIPLVRQLVEKKKVKGELFHGQWIDIGDIQRFNSLNQHLNPPSEL